MHITPRPADAGAVHTILRGLKQAYPFLQMFPAGGSVLRREIPAVMLDKGPDTVVIAAAFHGQEWITSLVALQLCADIAGAWTEGRALAGLDIRRVCAGRRVIWLPQVNPDGVEIALHGSSAAGRFAPPVHRLGGDEPGLWQANARGVDINHNFPAGWETLQKMEQAKGIGGPSPRQWGGPCPASEPETKALIHLCRRIRPRHVIALHTQGEEIYWQYGSRTPRQSRLMAQVMAEASGYRAAAPEGLASHGGFKDWFIEETGRPGFTLELGRGHNPLPLSDFEPLYAKAREMLLLGAFM